MFFSLKETRKFNLSLKLVFQIFLVGSNLTYAQTAKIDSLERVLKNHTTNDTIRVELLNSIIYEVSKIDVEKSERLIETTEKLVYQLQYKKGIAEIIYRKGHLELAKSNYEIALKYFKEALNHYESLGRKKGISYSLNAIGMVYSEQGDISKSLKYYEKSLKMDEERNDLNGVSAGFNNIGNIYADKGDHEKAISYYTKAKVIKEEINDEYGIAKAYNNIGIIHAEQSNFPKALENFNKALELYEKIGNKLKVSGLLGNIGFIYQTQGNRSKSLIYFNRSLEEYKKQGNKRGVARSLNNIGLLHKEQNQNKKALTLFNEALKINEKINSKSGIASNLNNLGGIQLIIGNPIRALQYFKTALVIWLESGHQQGVCKSYIGIAKAYYKQKQNKKALSNALESQKIATKLKSIGLQKEVTELLSKIYGEIGYYKKAYDNHKRYKILSDSVFNKKNIQKITQLEYEYLYKGRLDSANRREVKLTEKIKVVDKNLVESQREKLLAIIGLLVITIILGVRVFLLKIRNIKSINQNILMEQKLLRSQMTPHFIFNSLSVLQGIILNKESKKAIVYLSKFSKLLRITLENSRDKVVTLENELKAVENYLIVQNLGADFPYDYSMAIGNDIDVKKVLTPPMMIQPFVENAIEHAFQETDEDRKINIKLEFVDAKLICSITDNGIGVDFKKKNELPQKKSLATKITSERLKMLSKEFKVETSIAIKDRKHANEKGTIVTLMLPYKTIEND